MGLELWQKSEGIASDTVTAIKASSKKVVRVVAERYRALIAVSVGTLGGKVIRIGHMGYSAQLTNVFATMGAFRRAVDYGITPGRSYAARPPATPLP